jgi:hypothetical protein
MQPWSDTVTDVWFRSPIDLPEIVEALGVSDVSVDAEDYWEWAVGTLDGVQLDVTRTHRRPTASVDTRIFRLDNEPMSNDLREILIGRLRSIARGRISWGRWVYLSGNDFDLQVVGQTVDG